MFVAIESGEKNFRFRLPEEVKDRFVAVCDRKRISQQDAIAALIEMMLVQDDAVQSMMLRQMEPREDLIAVVLRRLNKPKRGVIGIPD